LKAFSGCSSDEISKSIYVRPAPRVNLGPDTTLCVNDKLLLQVQANYESYLWQDGSKNANFLVKSSGVYWVEVTSGECYFRDSIQVKFIPPPSINLGRDTVLCEGQSLLLTSNNNDLTYLWQDGTTGQSFTVTQPGIYWVEVANKACQYRDTIKVSQAKLPELDVSTDTTLCLGQTLLLNIEHPDLTFKWSDNSTSGQLFIEKPGHYWVEYKLKGTECFNRKIINVRFEECLANLFIPNIITPNADGKNDTFIIDGVLGVKWHLKLYNRWGKQIADFVDYQNDWAGQGIDNGVYFYTLISQISGKMFKGSIQVVK
jgi:gliding motility-associated-like protein